MNKSMRLILISTLGATLLLSGCASIVEGTEQKITVQTPPVEGAQCYLQNDKGKWYLDCTPGTVCVHKSCGDLIVTVQKPGYEKSSVRIQSKTNGMTFGNALFGGIIGAGVDCADGAAFNYPDMISVPMKPVQN